MIAVGEDQTLATCVQLMVDHNISGMPVLNDQGLLVGIITEADILRHGKRVFADDEDNLLEILLYRQKPQHYDTEMKAALRMAVKAVMTEVVITVSPGSPVGEIAMLMIEHRINRIPVVEHRKPVGIISRHDIIRALAKSS